MPRTAKIIAVPPPASGAFNKRRAAGSLLRSQAEQLRQALVKLHADMEAVLAIQLDELVTEEEVAEYASKATALLHSHHPRVEK